MDKHERARDKIRYDNDPAYRQTCDAGLELRQLIEGWINRTSEKVGHEKTLAALEYSAGVMMSRYYSSTMRGNSEHSEIVHIEWLGRRMQRFFQFVIDTTQEFRSCPGGDKCDH